MTRSKIQKMKFFIFLLIFLLAQTAVCDGSFREKRDVLKNLVASDNGGGQKVISGKGNSVDKSATSSAGKPAGQQNAAGLPADAAKKPTTVEVNKTHQYNITSKPPDVGNKTTYTADKSNEVCILIRNPHRQFPPVKTFC